MTAQRRVERLQDVPISATVVSGAELQKKNLITLEQLTAETPAVVVTKGGAANRLSIRGVGSGDNNPLFEQSVATFVDNVYQGRSRSNGAAFLDLARVEILKGPQSVYFGNNAIAGVLNIVTRDPGDRLEGYVRGSYNFDFNAGTVEGAVGAPLTETLGIRVAGIVTRGNGYIRDLGLGGLRIPRVRSYAGRATVRWQPIDDLTWTIKASGERSRQTGAIADEIAYCPPDPLFTAGATGSCLIALNRGEDVRLNQVRSHSPGQGIDVNTQSYVSSLSYDAGPLELSSITAYGRTRYTQRLDTDGTSATLTHFTTPERFSQMSQEFRVATRRDSWIALDAGAYLNREFIRGGVNYNFTSLNSRLTGQFAALAPLGSFGQFDDYRQWSKTYATYAFATFRPTAQLTLAVGGRQSWVDKSISLNQGFGISLGSFGSITPYPTATLEALGSRFGTAAGLGVAGVRQARRSDAHLSPSAVFTYQPRPTLNIYAKYTNGFKAGGFNGLEHTGAAAALSFNPEYVDGYEAGIKSQWFDRRLTLNLAVFRNDFKDLQVSVSQNFGVGVINVIGNAGGARAQGVEVEGRWRVISGLTTGLSLTLLDSKFTDYRNAGGNALDVQQGRPFVDLTGVRTRYAPKYSGNYTLDYLAPITSGLKMRLNGSAFFTDRYNFSNNNDPFLTQGKYVRLGAILGITDTDERWEVSLVGKNLTNRLIRVFGTNLAQSRGSYLIGTDEPRSIALQANLRF
ncbi:TonB-dependent receptor [Sphingomonas naphthae]|uniref:TonB-dependent receptor n=1 Tax=Sphingomonas naphthae TaxID=1813468 RepID=A0ABY7TMJ9_9SPHN|nr:TonB-dependent receptor [Sphingomonas naphthae]WCT74461.1 TonB-dependent receptor [Sphingomonas naphthae]